MARRATASNFPPLAQEPRPVTAGERP